MIARGLGMTEPLDLDWQHGVLYHAAGNGQLRCELCPYRCLLRDGQTGRCGVRRRNGLVIETSTFATSIRHWTPVERKPLFHFRPGSETITLAAPGCTFRCNYCINFRISQIDDGEVDSYATTPVDPAELAAAAASRSASIALSYTEPSLAPELTLALAAAARPLGVDILWKSNGFLTRQATTLIAPALSAVNIDVKAGEETAHRQLTGAPLRPVLETIVSLREYGVWVEVSTPLIPGTNSTPPQLRKIARWIAGIDPGIPWHLLRFTPAFRMREFDPTPVHALETAVEIGRESGLRYVYVERALGPAGRVTHCPGCRAAVVRRGIWGLEVNELVAGRCPYCSTSIEGYW
jgi:pyruvate formate lyase activating enzyme